MRPRITSLALVVLAGFLAVSPSGAWASTDRGAKALLTSETTLAAELELAVATGLSEPERSRLAYELRGVQHPYARPAASLGALLTRAEAARASLKAAYARELALSRGGLLRSLRGFSARIAQAQARGIEVDAFAEQEAQYRRYAGQAATIKEFRDLTAFLAATKEEFGQLMGEFNREESAAHEAFVLARGALAQARTVPNLRLHDFVSAIDDAAQALGRARSAAELRRLADRLREQEASIRSLLDQRAAALDALAQADGALRRAEDAGVDPGEAAPAIAALRARLATAGTGDGFSDLAWRLRQQTQAVQGAIRIGTAQVTIPVPVIRQAMNLDCETAALQMALAAFGHHYTQAELFALENPDTRPPVMGPNHTVLRWGNPYTNYVGDVNGDDRTPTGYGVYYPVILAIARSHGVPNAYGGEGFAPSAIYAELAAGHPVATWVETGWAKASVGTWTAWDGQPIRYSLIEHVVTLSGLSPTMVRVNDPWHGTQYWISKATFEASWRDFNNMAVVFR